jgi:hypothetical protein
MSSTEGRGTQLNLAIGRANGLPVNIIRNRRRPRAYFPQELPQCSLPLQREHNESQRVLPRSRAFPGNYVPQTYKTEERRERE